MEKGKGDAGRGLLDRNYRGGGSRSSTSFCSGGRGKRFGGKTNERLARSYATTVIPQKGKRKRSGGPGRGGEKLDSSPLGEDFAISPRQESDAGIGPRVTLKNHQLQMMQMEVFVDLLIRGGKKPL